MSWPFYPSVVLIHELMFLVGGIVIGMTIMFIIVDRHERRMVDRHVSQVNGLLRKINELTVKRGTAESSRERERPSG